MSVNSRQTSAIIFFSMSAILIASFYFLFDFYVQKSAADFLNNWLKAEEISIAEGNLLTSTTKNQAVLLSSDFIKGMTLIDLSATIRSVQIHSGAEIDTDSIRDYSKFNQINIKAVGLFKKVVYTKIPGHDDMAIFFYVFSESIRQIYFITCGLIITLVAFSLGMILKVQRTELINRQKTSSEYAEKAARVAHDIRGPLGMIESIAEMNKDINPKIAEQISMALKRVDEVTADFIDGRKAIAKMQGPKLAPIKAKLHELDFYSIVQVALSNKKIQYPNVNFESKSEISFGIKTFAISKSEVCQIVFGLIDNAVEANATSISFYSEIVGNKINFNLTDNGEGMAPDILAKVGTKGFTYGKQNGSGLGAYYLQSTLIASGGKVSYNSKPNKGTMAHIELPFHTSLETAQPAFNVQNRELLILEDNTSLLAAWEIMLRSYPQIKVHYFYEPKALKIFVGQNSNKFALITDFDLQADQDGIDVATVLGLENHALLVTGRETDPEVRLKALRSGVPILGKNRLSELKIVTG
ncbi:MAG: ATP-binding protein [Bdellovibrionales bacterium]